MNRILLSSIIPSFKILNVFKYRWFTYFYLGHRTLRYMLWLNHIILLICNIIIYNQGIIYKVCLLGQIVIYLTALLKFAIKIDNKIINIIYYYCMTIYAQINGVINTLLGKNKPFWEKAESTRQVRKALDKNIILSLLLTVRNLFYGIIKKINIIKGYDKYER